ncbi:hypothetical protein QWY93_02800 [Echinicola jeungdonensis]|uniref:Uncharacterized protein n=1 Tax=Echinicola jeungdonensis TaxID=709343 RepID=A0ABV5J1N0_9BACT|nr:hypothetical protein [Echinicola jeungdonensis]MDN3668258.1 hypothetical protein [Echinicola jeungdonensis]
MAKYQQLRLEEKKLRERVDYLEKQVALKGPLAVEVDLAMLLKEESNKLASLRQSLDAKEKELVKLQDLPEENRSTIQTERLEQLISDLRAKEEQALILQDNINFLEEKQAQFGIDVQLNLSNELKLARESLEKVQNQLKALKTELVNQWHFDPGQMEDFDSLAQEKILELAAKLVDRREKELEMQRKTVGDQYNAMITDTLEELRKAVFSGAGNEVIRKSPTEWEIKIRGSFGGVSVSFNFNHNNQPSSLICTHRHHDGHTLAKRSTDLSRQNLIRLFMDIFWKKKKWWHFWHTTPTLPDSWK